MIIIMVIIMMMIIIIMMLDCNNMIKTENDLTWQNCKNCTSQKVSHSFNEQKEEVAEVALSGE